MIAEDIPLPKARYGFGASWDSRGGRDVDIDLQCVVVDSKGVIIDCAYYNNLKAGRAITHSGDEVVGKTTGAIQEMIWVSMRKLPAQVSVLLFVIAAYSGGQLQDVSGAQFHVCEERESCEIAVFDIERDHASVKVIGAVFKAGDHHTFPGSISSPADWTLRMLRYPAQRGQHFMDILPHLAGIICEFLPHAPKKQKVAFAMEKGSVLDLPIEMGRITVGLGWDVDEGECDLDVSAVLLDKNGADLEAVFFGRLESEEHGIQHTGDNLTGEGDGDDEQITVRLDMIGPQVMQVFFVVNIYTPHRTFRQVAQPYCRVVDDEVGSELCRYALRDAGAESGLIISKIAREASGRWAFHALGLPCKGRTYKDSLPQIRATCKLKTQSLLLRSQNSGDFSNHSLGSPPSAGPPTTPIGGWTQQAMPPPQVKTVCCSLQ